MNPDSVEDKEILGHGIFHSKHAHRIPPRPSLFEDALNYGHGNMSVDRLDYADKDVLCKVHDDEAHRRGPDRSFYGWLTFDTSLLRHIGLEVCPTPSTDARNLWHADLVLPGFSTDDQDEITQVAEKLRAMARWEDRPLNPRVRADIEDAGRMAED